MNSFINFQLRNDDDEQSLYTFLVNPDHIIHIGIGNPDAIWAIKDDEGVEGDTKSVRGCTLRVAMNQSTLLDDLVKDEIDDGYYRKLDINISHDDARLLQVSLLKGDSGLLSALTITELPKIKE